MTAQPPATAAVYLSLLRQPTNPQLRQPTNPQLRQPTTVQVQLPQRAVLAVAYKTKIS